MAKNIKAAEKESKSVKAKAAITTEKKEKKEKKVTEKTPKVKNTPAPFSFPFLNYPVYLSAFVKTNYP